VDQHPRQQTDGKRIRETAAHGGGTAQAPGRTGRGRQGGLAGHPPEPHRPEGRPETHREFHLFRTHRRGEDGTGPHAGGIPLRQRGGAHPRRHVGIHGEVLREPPHRRAPRLRGLRRGRTAHRGRAPQTLFGGAARRDREGAPGHVQHPAPDHG